ncbi:2,3-bisphosphoglycerate-independent phosphoglycerate mutase [Desulforhopalus singaporensis]|uniref:2,3-bisphosphoglycerate-independent phosphoglycerate mutase n=1 Tax=Desulforhopalus singaporensis TaxID=91360 RepID=A0A1H0U6J8_9BACT|nr:2,3-bisphosphoglycerate-independent phosphoglycerate mutase [Desulforhopalus singaporensis]SDP61781.1 phosphoglycerate mutase [Desulforhopalus singaporensis]
MTKRQSPPLAPLAGFRQYEGPLVTVVMDGIGIGSRDEQDGVFMANTELLDTLFKEQLMVAVKAHGLAVGLPSDKDMGNSEVGHNALGAGRVFSQGAKLVNEALESKEVFNGEVWQELKKRGHGGGTVHFIGLVSDGNVHSHIDQLYRLLDQCVADGIERVRVHALLDGRDVEQKSALDYIEPLERKLAKCCGESFDYRIASGGGRMVTTMDRYNANWSVVERGWKAHVLGEGRSFVSASEAVRTYYAEDPAMTDQYMPSFVVIKDDKPVGTMEDGDSAVFFNFRGDRAIEISRAFDETDFNEFDRKRVPELFYAGMMQYDGDALIPKKFLVQPPAINATLGEYLCATGITSYAVSETQKFGHVTYFWNGNRSGYIDRDLERYEEVASDRITFDLKPWMKAGEIADKVVEAIESGRYKFIRLNFANGDMVGHTGVEQAVRVGVECVDISLGRVLGAVKKARGIAVVTADHGNADCMWTEKNGKRVPMVAHTLNPVPFIVKDYNGANNFRLTGVADPGLANVAATLCVLLGYQPPEDYFPPLVELVG